MIFAGRTVLDWIARARSFGQQAVGVIDQIPQSNPVLQHLPESIISSGSFSSILISVILLALAAGGLGIALRRLLKN
jgi:hypothetical protein